MAGVIDRHVVTHVVLLCLPALAFCAIAGWFWLDEVPNVVRSERNRITHEYRRIAEEILESPRAKNWRGVWRKGFGGNRLNATRKWDHFTTNGMELVWIDASDLKSTRPSAAKKKAPLRPLVGRLVPVLKPVEWTLVFNLVIPATMALFLLSTAFGLVYFLRSRKEKDDFLAATAHDLTTPLAGMRLMIGVDEDAVRVLNERMIRLVGNLKDFLRLGGKRGSPVRTAFDLRAAYDEAYRLFRDDYRDLLDGDVPVTAPDAPLMAYADETLTVQVLWNLLGNDLKYAAPYGAVSVRLRRAGAFACLDVVDAGQGMTPRQMRHCFDRYYRAKTVKESGKGGFGIGLCTAREFARAMGGDLTVRANVPKGCVFTLALPLAAT